MLLQNAAKLTDGDKVHYLKSAHRHDYSEYEFTDGKSYAVDGGYDYTRRSYTDSSVLQRVENWNLTDEDSDETIRERFLWGTAGEDGKTIVWKPLISLSDEHKAAIMKMSPLHEIIVAIISGSPIRDAISALKKRISESRTW